MKIYLDYIFLINFIFDFLLLLSVTIILRRNIKISKIALGSLIGGLSIFSLFIKINSIQLFLLKIIISILMVITTFGFKNMYYTFKNLLFLYMSSMLLGGALYFLNIQFSYNHEGLIFYHNGLSINVLALIILSPIIIYTYLKQLKDLKINYSNYYKVDIKYKNKIIKLNAFLDTGNKLYDPITNIPIIVAKEKDFNNIDTFTLIPYSTINGSSVIKCIKPDEIKINNKIITKKVRIGLVKKIDMEGVGCILNPTVIGEL